MSVCVKQLGWGKEAGGEKDFSVSDLLGKTLAGWVGHTCGRKAVLAATWPTFV